MAGKGNGRGVSLYGNQLEHGVSVEKLLNSLSSRTGIEDIQNFSQISHTV